MNRIQIEAGRIVGKNGHNIFKKSVNLEIQRAKQGNLNETIKLQNTTFSMQNSIGYSAGLRPYRQGGIRLQKQNLKDKIIYHNYGHGGGGISVGYGCAYQVVEQLFIPQNVPLSQPVAVLGAGIIGLTTAYLLTMKGYRVNVYAQLYPFEPQKGKPQLTTTVAAGYWMPLKLGKKEQTKKVAKLTWDHYHQVMEEQILTGKSLGVTKMPTYCLNDNQGLTHFEIEGVIEPRNVSVSFDDNIKREAIYFPSLVIDSKKYLPYLISKMRSTGKITFCNEKFSSQSVLNKTQKHIFNCCGLYGGSLFGDKSVNKGLKGHVIAFDLNNHLQLKDYILFAKTKQGRWLLQVPHQQSGKLMLGISYQQGKKDAFVQIEQLKAILQNAQQFYAEVGQNQKNQQK